MTANRSRSILRAIAMLACAWLAWQSAYAAIAQVARNNAPALALRFDAHEAEALVATTDRALALDPAALEPRQVMARARQALTAQALMPAALRQIGIAQDQSDKAATFDDAALPYFTLSQKMSRRDLVSQLWLAGYGIKKGSYDAAIEQFDRLFRTNEGVRDLIFPQLLPVVGEPGMQAALATVGDKGTPWIRELLFYLLRSGQHDRDVAGIVQKLRRPAAVADIGGITQQLIANFAAQGLNTDALRLFDRSAQGRILGTQSGYFAGRLPVNRANGMPWQLLGNSDVSADWRSGDGGRLRLDVYAANNARLEVARQVRFAGPGLYQIAVTLAEDNIGNGAYLEILLSCGSGQARQVIWKSAERMPRTSVSAQFQIDGGCPAQLFALQAIGPERGEPLEVTISDIAIRTAGRTADRAGT